MKKLSIVLVVISLFGVTGAISAQNFSLGLKGGLNIPNLTAGGVQNPLNEGYESRLGANYGAFGEYHISKVFSLSLGAEFSSQGGQKDKFQAFVPAGPLAPVAQALGIDYLYADYKSVAQDELPDCSCTGQIQLETLSNKTNQLLCCYWPVCRIPAQGASDYKRGEYYLCRRRKDNSAYSNSSAF